MVTEVLVILINKSHLALGIYMDNLFGYLKIIDIFKLFIPF